MLARCWRRGARPSGQARGQAQAGRPQAGPEPVWRARSSRAVASAPAGPPDRGESLASRVAAPQRRRRRGPRLFAPVPVLPRIDTLLDAPCQGSSADCRLRQRPPRPPGGCAGGARAVATSCHTAAPPHPKAHVRVRHAGRTAGSAPPPAVVLALHASARPKARPLGFQCSDQHEGPRDGRARPARPWTTRSTCTEAAPAPQAPPASPSAPAEPARPLEGETEVMSDPAISRCSRS